MQLTIQLLSNGEREFESLYLDGLFWQLCGPKNALTHKLCKIEATILYLGLAMSSPVRVRQRPAKRLGSSAV